MKITRIEAIPVCIPRPRPFKSSLGVQQGSENAVVRIFTDSDLIGIGEASSIWDRRGRGERETINGLLSDALTGSDPTQISSIRTHMDSLLHRSYPAKAGVEMALYDLVGKMLDTPVYNLLGGQVRDRVLLSHSLSMGDPQDIVEQAARLAGEGYQTLKCKVGRDHQSDLKILEAIRREVGDITLRVDANMGWSSAKKQCVE